MIKTILLIALSVFYLYPASAQTAITPPGTGQGPLDYVCPMDPDVRSDKPGVCPRCGMTLKLGI